MTATPEVILASAGTGKTFRLAGRFLKLLFQGVSPDAILATTFTRKASGEILDRVLSWLSLAIHDKEQLADLRKATDCFDETIINEKTCQSLLTQLIPCLDSFNVRTLDSFFVEAAKVYALELGMPTGLSICEEEEDERLRADALTKLFSQTKPKRMGSMLFHLSGMAPSRSVHDKSLELFKNALDILRNSEKDAWEAIQPGKGLLDVANFSTLLEKLEEVAVPVTLNGGPRKNYRSNKEKIISFLTEHAWKKFLNNRIVIRIRDQDNKFDGIDIPNEWKELMSPFISHAQNSLLGNLHARNSALCEFATLFRDSYQELKQRRASYRFEDFPNALADAQKLAENKHASFRLGRTIQHLLLDEFQDTSVTQWQVLKPIVERVISQREEGASIFCVGDLKQSIYGWRDGEPRLLGELGERKDLQKETMDVSWRSSQAILDAVNIVFGDLANNEVILNSNDHFLEEAKDWDETFSAHSSAKTSMLGKVVLRQNPEPSNADGSRAMSFRLASKRAQEIHEKNPAATIGILVRKRSSGNRIIKLLQDQGTHASGEGGNPLTDSQTVLAVLALLHLADHPEDSAAAFHVGSSFLGEEYELSTEQGSSDKLVCVAERIRKEVQEQGYGKWAETIFGLLDQSSMDKWNFKRMQQFVDLAHQYESKASLRCSHFVEFVRKKKVENPNSAPIKVMTIHQSKGLEFDVVILPELGEDVPGGRPDTLLTSRSNPGGNLEAVSFSLPKDLVPIHPTLERMYWERKKFLFREQMCVLYVAMTRAKHHLEMIVPALKETKSGFSFGQNLGSLLRAGFKTDPKSTIPILWQTPKQEKEWEKKAIGSVSQTSPQDPSLQLNKSERPRILPRRAPSSTTETKHTVSQLFTPDSSGAKLHGTLVHALFESVQWADHFECNDSDLLDSIRKLGGSEPEHNRAIEVFRNAMACPELRHHLSLESWPDVAEEELEILAESPFRRIAEQKGERVLMNGFIDRLVLQKNSSGEVIQAIIYDFKTDCLKEAGSLKKQEEHHEPQMAAYRDAVGARYGLKESCVSSQLIFTDLAKQPS
tara:strand:+ start:4909 stop:8064 length:3156 start_codon:yes stop_codon:yes gene_type:complete